MDFVRATFDRGIPQAGICFGHQLLAQALGGDTRKAASGWGVGNLGLLQDLLSENALRLPETLRVAASASCEAAVDRPRAAALIADFLGLADRNRAAFRS